MHVWAAPGALSDADFFQFVAASLGDGVFVIDTAERILYANPAAETILGAPLPVGPLRAWSASLERADSTPYPYDELPPVQAARGESPPATDVVLRAASGALCISMTSRPLRDRAERLIGSVTIFRDVSSQRRAQEELARAGTFLDSIVENIPDMIFVKEARDLTFERFNRAGEELLGLSREHLLGKNDYDFFPQEQADFFQKRDRDTLREGRLVDIPEEPIDTKHGRRWLHTKKIPILDEQGNAQYLLGISSDITARRQAEEALKQAHDELERRVAERTEELRRAEEQLRHAQKMEAVGRLAGGIAHDFNNALAVILGHVSVLSRGLPESHPTQTRLMPIREAAERAAALTKQLLAFSRKQVLQPRTFSLNRRVAQISDMLARLLGEDVELVTRLAFDTWDVHVDPALIEQVIVNLAVNARDAMPDGGTLTIETLNTSIAGPDNALCGRPKDCVILRVTDTGVGMDEATKTKIFEPFFTTKPPGKGTGLGLSMVYGVVMQSGGSVHVDSELGRGTTVSIELPRAPLRRSQTPATGMPSVVTGGGETILLVEDEASLRRVVRLILEQASYQVIDAASGEEALERCAAHAGRVHLVLSDVVMPGMDGPELVRRLSRERPGLRVLYMSGYTDDRLAGHNVVECGLEYLAKPFTPEALTAKVREVLDQQ